MSEDNNIYSSLLTIELNTNQLRAMSISQINLTLANLHSLEESNIISVAEAEKQWKLLMNAKEKKIIETYPIRIWQASNGTWKAHVPDETKDRNRRIIQGKSRENLENNILEDYQKKFDDKLVFSNYFANWLINYKATIVQPPTIQRNYDDYRKYIEGSSLDSMRITEIKRSHIKALANQVINKHFLTKKSLGNLMSIFNGLFEYAIDCEDILINPMNDLKIVNSNIRVPETKTAETEIFNEEEFDVFVKYLYEHYMEHKPIVSLAILLNFQLGLRVGELCALKKSDVNFKHRKIAIDRMERSYRPISLSNGKIVEEATIHEDTDGRTKSDSNRRIRLSDEAEAIIHRTLELHQELHLDSEYLFPDERGNHIIRQRVNDCLRHYCKQVALSTKSSHKIRKTVLSNLFENNFDIEEVMQIAGHRQKSTTLEYYVFSTKVKDAQRERLNKALNSNHCAFSQP